MLSPSSWLLLYDSRYKGSQKCTRLSPIDGQQVLLWKLEMSAETVSRFVEIFRNHLQNIWQISNIATEWVTDTCQTAVVWTVFELLDYFFCLPWDVSKGFNTLEKWHLYTFILIMGLILNNFPRKLLSDVKSLLHATSPANGDTWACWNLLQQWGFRRFIAKPY